MNKARKNQYGSNENKDFKKDYLPSANFFFVRDEGEIVSFGTLRDIPLTYLGKKYNILGICNIIAIKKGLDYGRLLVSVMISYMKKNGKSGLGFCSPKNMPFYQKAGLSTEKDFTQRFIYKNPKTGEERRDEEGGDGLYYNGKDNFIKTVLSNKSNVYYYLLGINMPHW